MANLAIYLLCIAVPAGVVYLATRFGDVSRVCAALYRKVRPAPPPPAPVSIERVAADLRRVSRILREYRAASPAVSMVKWRGAQMAYERRLVDACGALDIPQRLLETVDVEHEFELGRVERALQRAGLAFTPPWPEGESAPIRRFVA